MNWTKGSAYHLESDGAVRYTIAKTFHDDRPLYALWCGKEQMSVHDSAIEAMKAAEVLPCASTGV